MKVAAAPRIFIGRCPKICKEDFSTSLEMTLRAKRYQNFAALLIFMRRTTTLNPPT